MEGGGGGGSGGGSGEIESWVTSVTPLLLADGPNPQLLLQTIAIEASRLNVNLLSRRSYTHKHTGTSWRRSRVPN